MMAPDKEAAAVFLVLGYYPIVKPKLETQKFSWLWKGLLFNGSILLLYWVLLNLIGVSQLLEEFSGMGIAMTALLLILGNVTFFLLDRLLGMRFRKRSR
jgi:Na+-translocating ferredoxin:NAD+ oxidoreductase RnfA subunit